jgi:putative endonuclease
MAYVYILTNRKRGVLYIGVTREIENRLAQYEMSSTGFAQKYNLTMLVHLEEFPTITEAIVREKQIKNWHRDWKMNLIEQSNPKWNNLVRS